jgi:hypothetical protein
MNDNHPSNYRPFGYDTAWDADGRPYDRTARQEAPMHYTLEGRSHINSYGYAKVTYATLAEACEAAAAMTEKDGRERRAYLCVQRPDHYHVTTSMNRTS